MKDCGPFFDAHQLAPDKRLKGGRRQIFLSQIGKRDFTTAGRKLGQDSLLLLSQLGQARLRNQNREALHAPRVATSRGSLARNPFFAHQRRELR